MRRAGQSGVALRKTTYSVFATRVRKLSASLYAEVEYILIIYFPHNIFSIFFIPLLTWTLPLEALRRMQKKALSLFWPLRPRARLFFFLGPQLEKISPPKRALGHSYVRTRSCPGGPWERGSAAPRRDHSRFEICVWCRAEERWSALTPLASATSDHPCACVSLFLLCPVWPVAFF